MTALHESNPTSLPLLHRGKVRDIYGVDDQHLLIVQTDRLSAFDVILPSPVPGKGAILTTVSNFWFSKLGQVIPNHLSGIAPEDVVKTDADREQVKGRAFVVKRLKPLPIEAIVRGYLGAGVQDVAKEVAESLGVKANTGVLVAEVTRGGPAEKAGVQNGDIILTLNGRPVNSREELVRGVALTEPGKPLNLQVLRAGKTVALVATAGVRPSETALANRNNPEGGGTQGPEAAQPGKTTQLGLALSPITDAARRQFDIRTGTEGVLIAGVADGSDAARKGLRPGDVILSINQQSVNSPKAVADLVAAAAKAGRQSVFLLINRAGQTAPVVLKIEK